MSTASDSRSPRRGFPYSKPGDDGFTVIEAVVAILLLGIVVLGFSGDIMSSNTGTRQAQARQQATLIGQQTIQEVEGLGYSTVSEGIGCTPPASGSGLCTLAQTYGQLLQSSGSCWYYGNPSNNLLVPTVNETSAGQSGPIIPYLTSAAAGSNYLPYVDNGITYTVTAVPVYTIGTAPDNAVSCSQINTQSTPNVPITVMVQVSWTMSGRTQTLGMQTTLFDSPPLPPTESSCSVATSQMGGHVEAHLALPSSNLNVTTGSYPGANDGGYLVKSDTPTLGSTTQPAQIFFLDEAPTTYSPTYCLLDSAGNTYNFGTCLPGPCPSNSLYQCGDQTNCPSLLELKTTYFGNAAANPFLLASGGNKCKVIANAQMVAVHGSFGGSSPNACQPPTAGTYCQDTYPQSNGPVNQAADCNVEELWQIYLPATPPSPYQANVLDCVTVAGWDHEGDFDSYSWAFNGYTNCP